MDEGHLAHGGDAHPLTADTKPLREQFLEAALWHGDLARAEELLAAHPEWRRGDIHVAAVLGDADEVARLIAERPSRVQEKSGPHGGDALNYLGLSKYLRLEPELTPAFVRTATILLDAGADPNTGFRTPPPYSEYESVLYGAAGVAQNESLTRLLLERGADPNDVEVCYHSPESYDLAAMKAVVETGRVTDENLTMMLVRKCDWHDLEGVKYLLSKRAPVKNVSERRWSALHHSIRRDNRIEIITLLVEHGGDIHEERGGMTALELAIRRGRSDVLDLLASRGTTLPADGYLGFLVACARDDGPRADGLAAAHPELREQLQREAGTLLAEWALAHNGPGLRRLLDLGLPVDSRYGGEAYFGIPKDSTPLHVAAWMLHPKIARLLLDRGADPQARNGNGETPLAVAERAGREAYWSRRATPELPDMLRQAMER